MSRRSIAQIAAPARELTPSLIPATARLFVRRTRDGAERDERGRRREELLGGLGVQPHLRPPERSERALTIPDPGRHLDPGEVVQVTEPTTDFETVPAAAEHLRRSSQPM